MTRSPFKSWRRFLVAFTGVCVVFVVLGLVKQGRTFVEDSDRKVWDRIIRSGGGPEEREDFVLLGIDEASMSLDANLTDEEVASATEAGWQPIGLGPRILRIETAAIAIAAQLAHAGGQP